MKNTNRLSSPKNRPNRGSPAMYPIAYRWISAPTPVTTSAIVIDSGSTRRLAVTWKLPTEIQSNSRTTWTRSFAPNATRSRSTATPASGSAGRSQTSLSTRSPSEHRNVVDARARLPAVDVHDDRQAHHDLGRGDHHGEEREDLAVQIPVHPAERDEREVHRVQLELDRHEDHERVLADEHADRADREQHRREDHEVRDRRPHVTLSGSRIPSPLAAASCSARVIARRRREASAITAIAATSSKTEVASNGN